MIPGLTTKLSEETLASATSINPTKDLVLLSGSTALATIVPHFGGGFSGILVLVPLSSTIGLVTSGNIAIAVTMAVGRATVLVYSKSQGVWYPGAIS